MKQYLVTLLTNFLAGSNFNYDKKNSSFVNYTNERNCTIRLDFFSNKYVQIYYGIKFNKIERIIDGFYNRDEASDLTIFINTGNLLVKPELYKFSIQSLEEVEITYSKLEMQIRQLAFPYFDDYNSLEKLHQLLNVTPYKAMKIRNVLYHNETMHGFFRGITAAKLLKLNIGEIKQWHLKYLTDNDYGTKNIEHYLNFYEYINKVV